MAEIRPDEPDAIDDATAAAAHALEHPHSGPRFSELLAGAASVAIVIDNQFRPTPQSRILPAVFDALEAAGVKDAVVVCANGKVFPMSESDTEQKIGKDNLARMQRLGIPFFQNDPQNEAMYTFVGVSSRGTPVWLHKEVARCDLKITIGQAQSNHWGAGGGGKLILPGVTSDETVESNHCAFVPSPQTHYGAYRGPMRSDIDEVATMCGLQCTMNALLDTRGRVIDIIFGKHPDAHRAAIEKFNSIYAYEHPAGEQADIADLRRLRADPTTSSSTRGGAACRPTSCSRTAARSSTAVPRPACTPPSATSGPALMDLMGRTCRRRPRTTSACCATSTRARSRCGSGCIWVPIYEVMTRKRLTMVTLEENLAHGRRHRHGRDDLARRSLRRRAGAQGPGREGHHPAVRALPAAAQPDPHECRRDAPGGRRRGA